MDIRNFSSLDRSIYGSYEYIEPDRFRHLDGLLDSGKSMIARGAGLSYVAASFGHSAVSVGMGKFDKILAFNESTIKVQAGASVWAVQKFLLKYGKCLPVQPGYPHISIGGCIACNVHGKNQFLEGLFCDWVSEIDIYIAEKGMIKIKPGDLLFDLTAGGFGLTGIIVSATINIRSIKGASIVESYTPTKCLNHTLDILIEKSLNQDLLYSWNNLSSLNSKYGSGFVVSGVYSNKVVTKEEERCYTLSGEYSSFAAPIINPITIPLISKVYQLNQQNKQRNQSIYAYSYPAASQGYYFDMYGRQGFFEMQVLIDISNWNKYVDRFKKIQQHCGMKIALTSMKLFSGKRKLLNFNGSGVSFAIDMPRNTQSIEFSKIVDDLNCDFGAISCIHKDSRLSAETIKRQYGDHYSKFRELIGMNNHKGSIKSHLSSRLDL